MNNEFPIFRRIDDLTFVATEGAAGPWSGGHCHGGAPAALLAWAIEAMPTSLPMEVARLTLDLMRAVPVAEPLRIESRILRQGQRIQLIEAQLLLDEVPLVRATGLKVRAQARSIGEPLHCEPDAAAHRPMPGGFSEQFTIVPVNGGFGQPGPADVWFRLNADLIAGEPAGPLPRALAAADFGSGAAHELAFEDWQFPSLDLTVSLHRPPIGCWTRLGSRWLGSEGGRTICASVLSDRHGPFGEATQTVLIEARRHQ